MEPIIGMEDPYHYRNKAQFPVGCDKDGHRSPDSMPEEPIRSSATGTVISAWKSTNRS